MTTITSKETESQPDLIWDPEEDLPNKDKISSDVKDIVDKEIVITHNWQRKYLKGNRMHEDVQASLDQIVEETKVLLAKQKTGVAVKGEDMVPLLRLLRDEKFKTGSN